MPLGKSHRRPEKPLPDDSLKDGLYDQLLTSLTQGGEPIATKEECSQWERENRNRPDRGGALFADETALWPIRRYDALDTLRVLTYEKLWLPLAEGKHEQRRIDSERSETDEPIEPLDVEKVRADYLQWRNNIIRKYRLEGLLPELDK